MGEYPRPISHSMPHSHIIFLLLVLFCLFVHIRIVKIIVTYGPLIKVDCYIIFVNIIVIYWYIYILVSTSSDRVCRRRTLPLNAR